MAAGQEIVDWLFVYSLNYQSDGSNRLDESYWSNQSELDNNIRRRQFPTTDNRQPTTATPMDDNSDKILQSYIENVLKLQQEREKNTLSDSELKQIALDSGMTEADLAYVQQKLVGYLNRGRGFIRYENWDGAISELEQAVVLAPHDITVLNLLASSHAGRWNSRATAEDHDKVMHYARRVLQIDSSNDTALRLISSVQKKRSSSNSMARKVTIGIFLLAILIVTLGLLVFTRSTSDAPAVRPAPVVTVPQQPVPQAPVPAPPPPESPVSVVPETDPSLAQPLMTFGAEGIGPGQFNDARSIAVDGNGKIYVGEYSGGRVQVFDAEGKFITQWNIGSKKYMPALTADRKGTVYVIYDRKINRFNGENGESLGEVGGGKGAGFTDVVATPDGGLLAAWDGNSRGGIMINPTSKDDIVRINSSGKVVKTIPRAISGVTDEIEMQTSVAIDGRGNIYALGQYNHAVFKFSPEGKFVNRFGNSGGKSAQLLSPSAIAVDGQGRVYVADFGGVRIFDGDGGYIGTIEVKGAASGLAIDDQDNLYVVARTTVQKFKTR